MYKKLMVLSFLASFSFAHPMVSDYVPKTNTQPDQLEEPFILEPSQLFIPEKLGTLTVSYDGSRFSIIKDESVSFVQPAFLDKELRSISKQELMLLLHQPYMNLKIMQDDELMTQEPRYLRETTEEEKALFISQFFLQSTFYIEVKQTIQGDYILKLKGRLPGGGIWGAWAGAWGGKFITHLIAQTIIMSIGGIVSIVATPAAGVAVVMALEKTAMPAIEATSIAMAVAGSISLSVLTGPV
jgi:hypothetical protein